MQVSTEPEDVRKSITCTFGSYKFGDSCNLNIKIKTSKLIYLFFFLCRYLQMVTVNVLNPL